MGNAAFEPRKFAVIGAGPVGSIVAAFLAHGGYEVTLCDINPTLLEPALSPGISIEGTDTILAKVTRITTRIEDLQLDPPDVIVVAVKAIALPAVASALRGFFDARSAEGAAASDGGPYVISWQNGIDTELLLAQQLGNRCVMRGVVNLGCVPLAPGYTRIGFHIRPHHLQELDPSSREAAVAICKVFTACGLDTHHSDQIRDLVWRKAILNGCMNPICAVTGKTMAELIEDPILFHLVGALIKEGVAVARANEYALGSGFYPYCIDYIKSAGHHKPSMLQDIEAGRRTEVDFINGKIAEYGAQAEVPTPYNTMIRGLVKALESKGHGNGLEKVGIDIRTKVESLSARMLDDPQYPSQGAVLFVDLERRKSFAKYLPKEVFRTFLSNRGGNLYLLYNLLLEGREALDPQVPLIFGSGVLKGAEPAGARGHVASVSPDHQGILDSNCHSAFPAFLKMQGYDHLVLYGQASAWTLLELSPAGAKFHDAAPYLGMDNRDFTQIIEKDFSCVEAKDMAMARITRAGENQVLCSAIMGGPKAAYARGGTGAKMGALKLKAVLVLGQRDDRAAAAGPQPASAAFPALWPEQLDAEHLAGYRAGLEGCQQCPIRCNNLDPRETRRPLDQHWGLDEAPPEGLGPRVGISDPAEIALLNRMTHHLGLDPASTGAAIAWAMALYAGGLITRTDTRGLELHRGDTEAVKKLLSLTAKREGFGDVIADSTQAIARGKYPEAARPYGLSLSGLGQADPHDERILEGFAQGFAEAARGQDATLPVEDAMGLCRFAARQAQAVPGSGLGDLASQMAALTGEPFSAQQLEEVGLNISGMERLLQSRLGLVEPQPSLLDAWLDEEVPEGPFAGEKLDKTKFGALQQRTETLLGLAPSGVPPLEKHRSLATVTTGFAVKVTLPDHLPGLSEAAIILDQPLGNVADLRAALKRRFPQAVKALSDNSLIMAVGGTLVMGNEKAFPVHHGDEVAVLRVQAGL